MITTHRRAFWMTNHVANPVLRRLLRRTLGRRLGRRLAVLRYRGRRTGETHELVIQYLRDGNTVWIMPGQAERKRWWRNMLEPRPVDLWIAGAHLSGIARVAQERIGGGGELTKAVAEYHLGFPLASSDTMMVRVDLAPPANAKPAATGTTINHAVFGSNRPVCEEGGLRPSATTACPIASSEPDHP